MSIAAHPKAVEMLDRHVYWTTDNWQTVWLATPIESRGPFSRREPAGQEARPRPLSGCSPICTLETALYLGNGLGLLLASVVPGVEGGGTGLGRLCGGGGD